VQRGAVRIDENRPLLESNRHEGDGREGDELFGMLNQLEAAKVRLLNAP